MTTTENTTNELTTAKQAGAIAPMSIKDTVLAQFKEAETSLTTLADRYRNVAYDTTTPQGMRDAIAARADLRDNGRLFVTRAEKRIKADVNDLKRVMTDEVERLVAITKPVEESIDKQIKVEEERKSREKAERERIEAERVGKHRANIDKLKSYVACAEGKPLEAIEKAIESIERLELGDGWEEFLDEAIAARDNTIAGLRKLVSSEHQRLENERLAQELAEARAALAALAASKATEPEPAPAPAPAPASKTDAAINVAAPSAPEAAETKEKPAQTVALQAQEATNSVAQKLPIDKRVEAGQTMTLGLISALMGVFDVKATTLAALGIAAEKYRGAVHMDASDFDGLCAALIAHIQVVRDSQAA